MAIAPSPMPTRAWPASRGTFWPYRTVNIPEDGPVLLTDTPPHDPPSFGVMKALSENTAREGFPKGHLVVRPGYIVGPGDGRRHRAGAHAH